MVFLAAREAAHQRLFTHVPWLRQRLLDTVEEFAKGIKVDTSALEQLAGQIDPANPQSIEEAMQSGMLEPQTTPEQKAALNRLETLLALVEGWVDVVVDDAVGRPPARRGRAARDAAPPPRLRRPGGADLRHARRAWSCARAGCGPPSALWKLVGDQHGVEVRDSVWEHAEPRPDRGGPGRPAGVRRAPRRNTRKALEDPIAELERTMREDGEKGDKPDEA